jgi:nitrate reductase delta subunit
MSLWADASRSSSAFGAMRKGVAHLEAVERVKDVTRARFALAEGDTILVTESVPTLPGFPPHQTKVVFWTADATRHHFKVFKPVEDVADDDIPPAWLRESLTAAEAVECSCC